MERRKFLQLSASGLTVSTIGIAGCGAIGGLEIADMDSQTTALGNIEVLALVENTGGSSQDGELVTQVDIDGGDTYTEREVVTVAGDSSNSYTHSHDISFSASLSAERYEYSANIE